MWRSSTRDSVGRFQLLIAWEELLASNFNEPFRAQRPAIPRASTPRPPGKKASKRRFRTLRSPKQDAHRLGTPSLAIIVEVNCHRSPLEPLNPRVAPSSTALERCPLRSCPQSQSRPFFEAPHAALFSGKEAESTHGASHRPRDLDLNPLPSFSLPYLLACPILWLRGSK